LQHDPRLAAEHRASQRHYGMDWLRIAAFALLILYHIAMAFSPWAWVIKTNHAFAWLIPPMALLTPWRLPLLFAVSGYASAKLLARSPGPGAFARSRARRLLVPLAFGMAVLVPPEMWVRVMENGYHGGYLRFWAVDYWRVGLFYGREFPSWEHLWFLAYLATYTLILAGALAMAPKRLPAVLARAAAWLGKGYRLLWAPMIALAAVRLALLFVASERQGLLRDWGGHSQYLPVFLFGFALAGAPALWPAVARCWRAGAAIAALAGGLIVAVELAYPGTQVPSHAVMAIERAARSAMGWGMILTLFHIAETRWNHDGRWRKPLAEAVFPFYLVHHPAIVLIAWYSLPLGLSAPAEFALLLAGTGAVCAATYLVGPRIGWLRPLIGLNPLAKRHHPAREAAPASGVA
jgi:glucans biosynthesis protein C